MNITLKKQRDFDPAAFLAKAGLGREIVHQLVNNRQPNILTKQTFPVYSGDSRLRHPGRVVDPETEALATISVLPVILPPSVVGTAASAMIVWFLLGVKAAILSAALPENGASRTLVGPKVYKHRAKFIKNEASQGT
jgi:hypothetical protein